MRTYRFKRGHCCHRCATAIRRNIRLTGESPDRVLEDFHRYPQGPLPGHAVTATRPLHCMLCRRFLRNELNDAGISYVIDAVGRGRGVPEDLTIWRDFYLCGYQPTRKFNVDGIAVVAY